MTRKGIRAGQTINLRARFKDDLNDAAQASGVYIHLFEPDTTVFDLANAYLVSGVPNYLGEGIYEYPFTVPGNGPDGYWYDEWDGILTGQPLDSRFQFEVSASGLITELPAQLYQNNIVRITIASGIEATDGTKLENEYEFEFLTITSPSYTNIRKINLEIGGFIGNIEDDTIQLGILEGSLEADVLSFNDETINSNMFNHARREYVTCLVASMLLNNLGSFMLKSKSLDNLRVEYDTAGLRDAIDRLRECAAKWEPQLLSGGGAKAIRSPQYVVKGDFDPDRPIVSRMWQSTEIGTVSRRMPIANEARRPLGRRRHLRTYRKKWW